MKRIYIIVEGQTEEEFVNSMLQPYFYREFGIYDVRAIQMTTNGIQRGGAVTLDRLKHNIDLLIKQESNIVVSTFLDFFRLHSSFSIRNSCFRLTNSNLQINCLEESLSLIINSDRFLPYIQRHEFETLLFSSNDGFESFWEDCIHEQTASIINEYSDPEEINGGPQTAPSKRIIEIFKTCGEKYDKVADGNLVALEIGLDTILNRCPRFKNWIFNLAQLATS